MKKPSSLSEAKQSRETVDRSVEEAWILWKLDRKKEAEEIVLPLCERFPDNEGLLDFALSIYLNKGDTRAAWGVLEKIKTVNPKKDLREVEAELYAADKEWEKAKAIYDELVLRYPERWDLRESRANMFLNMKQWREARQSYEEILEHTEQPDKYIKDYLYVLDREGRFHGVDFSYYHGPQSLRRYVLTEKFRAWTRDRVRWELRFSEEIHKDGVYNQTILGHAAHADWFATDIWTAGGEWRTDYLGGNDHQAFGVYGQMEQGNYEGKLSFDYNALVRDPLEGLPREGKKDTFHTHHGWTFFDRVNLKYLLEVEWYRMDPNENVFNGKRDLGYKWIHEGSVGLVVLNNPYVSLDFRVRRGCWEESFAQADSALGFLPNEKSYSGGVYVEKQIGPRIKVHGGYTRLRDVKRNVYAFYANGGVSFWVRDDLRLTADIDAGFGDSGTSGSGNSYTILTKLEWYY